MGYINLLIANAGITGLGLNDLKPHATLSDSVNHACKSPMHEFNSVYELNCTVDSLAPRVLVDVPSLRHSHFGPELDMGFEDVLHDMGISRGRPATRSSEQDQYTPSTPESPIPDDKWSSFVNPAPFFPSYGQAGGRKQSYTSLESAYSLYETVTESTEHT